MEKKILKVQLYSLFLLTTLNLVYFYYRDNLPDNYYEIAYRNLSINFFTYYFFTLLANFGYWCGIWVTSTFIIFALLNSFIFHKNQDLKNLFVIAILIPLTLEISYFFLPDSLGEGLFFLIKENFSTFSLIFSLFIFSLSFFYLVSEKNFFKFCYSIYSRTLILFELIRTRDYSLIKSLNLKNVSEFFKTKLPIELSSPKNAIAEFKADTFKIKPPHLPPFKYSEPSKILPISQILIKDNILVPDNFSVSDEIDDFNDAIDDELVEDNINDFKNEILIPKPNNLPADAFFDSFELIDCLVPKNHTNKINDPSDVYFNTISKAIEEKLKEFNISSNVINVLKGPVVDTFELELGTGVKVAGVTNRTDDLSLALMGAPIRMVYPMKGKSTIGIEVPRNPRDVIYLDEVLKSPNFNNSSFKLPIAMGKDAYGDAAVIDLAATPHLLVAGTTGAGKSVFINTLLVSLIIKFSPKKLRLIMLDPKQLELALFSKLPHLIMPVVTDPSVASVALLWTIDEMEKRYSLLKDFGVKNIEGFNKKIQIAGMDLICKINKYYPDSEVIGFELPYIVVVVDEFADLMLSKSGKAIEVSISKLAAKARASGIHIVLATQRPSTDIITGVIKANFPTRVSFRVFTNIDSRVILDGVGAEKLLGKGDMLFKQGIDILRMHSAFVNEDEIEALVNKLSTLPTQYDTGAMDFIESNGLVDTDVEGITSDGEGGPLKDDKYDEAVRCVALHRVASASFLQRRLGVGYNRAANLIEEMERYGIVGPAQGSKPRKVLVPLPTDSTP
jgi:S-DNA-T family DNA segregation ATPase FtsK/SpoIIIE